MALSNRARSFCCFLPSVIGVFGLSFVWIIGGTIIAITAWSQVLQLSAHPISVADEVALYFHSLIFTLLAVIGIFGTAAASLKRPGLVLSYMSLLGLHLLLSLGGGSFTLYTIYRVKSNEEIVRCLTGAKDEVTMQVCSNGLAIIKAVAVAIYAVSWVLEIYACFIVFCYLSELKEPDPDPELASSPKKPRRPSRGEIKPGDIGSPRLISHQSTTLTTSEIVGRNYPISIIDSFGTIPQTQGHVGVLSNIPSGSSSPPTTPVTPSRPDFVSGKKPFLLSQPRSAGVRHVNPADISAPAPLTTYNSAGAAGLNTGYAFSTVAASFGSNGRPPPPVREGSWTYIRDGTERS